MKKLRDLYNNDPAAKKFLEEHPEFNDRFIEQIEHYSPGFNISVGRYSLQDVTEEQKQYGALMYEAFVALREDHAYKNILRDYYDGMKLRDITTKYNIKNIKSTWSRISKGKVAALKNLVKIQQVRINDKEPKAVRVFTYQGTTKLLYLVMDSISSDLVWVDEKGAVLPEYAQKILDEDPNFKEWDHVWL